MPIHQRTTLYALFMHQDDLRILSMKRNKQDNCARPNSPIV